MFEIQINNPTILSKETEDNISLEEAIESIFPLDTDYLKLTWNYIDIPLTYKYDISCMALDFIHLFKFIESDKENSLKIHWPSNTFSTIWVLQKLNGEIELTSQWYSVIGGTEDLLNNASRNIVKKNDFKEEIKKILFFLLKSLKKSGIKYDKIQGIELLIECC